MSEAELPEGWAVAKLGDGLIVDVQPGFACGAHSRGGTATIAHLRPMNVSVEGKIDLRDLKCVSEVEASRDERLVRQGDVLFNNTNSPTLVGKTAYYSDSVPRAFSNHMTRLRTHPEALLPPYVALTLHHLWQVGYFESACNNHVSQASVGRNVLLGTEIPLPPVAEQRRIVEKVEALLARVQAVRERLARVPLLLKRFRQAVLTAACDGRLTADWRTRTETERPVKDSKGAPALFEIPNSWQSCQLDSLCDHSRGICYGVIKLGNGEDKGVPCLRTSDVKPLRIDTTRVKRISRAISGQFGRSLLRGGEVLVAVRGTLGGVCAVPSALSGWNVSREVAVVPISSACPNYIAIVIASQASQNWLSDIAKGVAYTGINLSDLRLLPIPLPPLQEQHEIVRRVDALFKLADTIEARVNAATKRAEKLMQAVLAKAFRGELVPTEAELARAEGRDYESAATLLERIRATQPAAAPRASQRRQGVPASEPQHQRLERGRCVLDMLLLLDAWKKPVSTSALEPALVLMRNDAARKTLLAGKAIRRRRNALQEPPQWITGLDGIYRALEQSNTIRRVGQNAYALVNAEPLNRATAADRARAAEVLQAIQKLADMRDLPQAVAAVTHERYEVTI